MKERLGREGGRIGSRLAPRVSMFATKTWLTLGLFSASALACESSTTLAPSPSAPAAPRSASGVAALSTSKVEQSVRVTASTETWDGPVAIEESLTTLRLTVENQSQDEPLELRYAHFELVDADGDVYRAIPPFRIDRDAPSAQMAWEGDYLDHDWTGYGYDIYPAYRPIYGTTGMSYYDVGFGGRSYDGYPTYWEDVTLPTSRMLSRALPEGVVRPGGRVDGWLYFEQVDAEPGETVQLRTKLVNAETHASSGTLTLPFVALAEK
ncbi:MAG: hypothetical protein HC923_04590 [Myxococcales bacterium]|nr:hypothetical protein [Myxococcales bacterium]